MIVCVMGRLERRLSGKEHFGFGETVFFVLVYHNFKEMLFVLSH